MQITSHLVCVTGAQTSTHMCQQLPILPLAISQSKLITCTCTGSVACEREIENDFAAFGQNI